MIEARTLVECAHRVWDAGAVHAIAVMMVHVVDLFEGRRRRWMRPCVIVLWLLLLVLLLLRMGRLRRHCWRHCIIHPRHDVAVHGLLLLD